MSEELVRFAGLSIGIFDDRNYYVAEIKIAGEDAKDAGQERLEKMTFYGNLPQALQKASERVVLGTKAATLKQWAEAIRARLEESTAALNEAANRFARSAPKLKARQ